MDLIEIVRYIYDQALGMMGSWAESVFPTLTEIQATRDGFRVVATSAPEYWVGMKEFRSTIFVDVHEPHSSFGSMAYDQKKARAIYDQMLETLTASASPVSSELSCCGAPRPASIGDDEPCPNCGAI